MRIWKADFSFRKGYKQTFIDAVFEIYDTHTANPPFFSLIDASQEAVKEKFSESENLQKPVQRTAKKLVGGSKIGGMRKIKTNGEKPKQGFCIKKPLTRSRSNSISENQNDY